MKRRLFLRRAASFFALAQVASFGSASELCGSRHEGYYEVSGSPEQCQRFVEAFQTHLWPDWRAHKNDSARKQMLKCAELCRSGFGRVSTSGRQCRDALLKTLVDFGGCAKPGK